MQTSAILKALPLAFVMTLPVACGDPPTRPSTDVVVNPPPPPPSEPTVSSVLIEGPDTVPLGETAQFRVVARMTDGAARDLTETADWTASRQVALEGPGLVRGVTKGDAEIGARVETRSRWETSGRRTSRHVSPHRRGSGNGLGPGCWRNRRGPARNRRRVADVHRYIRRVSTLRRCRPDNTPCRRIRAMSASIRRSLSMTTNMSRSACRCSSRVSTYPGPSR